MGSTQSRRRINPTPLSEDREETHERMRKGSASSRIEERQVSLDNVWVRAVASSSEGLSNLVEPRNPPGSLLKNQMPEMQIQEAQPRHQYL